MGERYVEIRIGEMHKLLHDELGFEQANNDRSWEHIYERRSENFYCTIRVYTSVDIRSSVTRACAKDAIRVVVLNEEGYPIKRDGKSREARIYRTKGAKDNLRKRVEELIFWIKTNACPDCRYPLTERVVKKEGANQGRPFLTCTNKDCNHFEWADQTTCPDCGETQVVRTVKKEGPNQGRKFRTCVNNHFEWVE